MPEFEKMAVHSYEQFLLTLLENAAKKEFFVLAIEGDIAAGKSTLAKRLQADLKQKGVSAQIVSMDDYYYPRNRKREKFEGNCDLKRLEREVLIPFQQEGTFKTARFNPALQEFEAQKKYESQMIILEGNYSLHPSLAGYIDLSLFLAVDSETQQHRLQKRDPKKFERFEKQWIPQSQAYFDHYQIRQKADFIRDFSEIEPKQAQAKQ